FPMNKVQFSCIVIGLVVRRIHTSFPSRRSSDLACGRSGTPDMEVLAMSAPAAPDGTGPSASPAPGGGPSGGPGRTRRTNAGFGRFLVAVYGVFALAATARAAVQILRDWDEAPLAYALSGLAAVV